VQRQGDGNARRYYPKREYWLSVIYGIATRPGFSERLALDLARLKIETGTMRGAEEYLDAAQLSLQEGFPMEAVKIIDKGLRVRRSGHRGRSCASQAPEGHGGEETSPMTRKRSRARSHSREP